MCERTRERENENMNMNENESECIDFVLCGFQTPIKPRTIAPGFGTDD